MTSIDHGLIPICPCLQEVGRRWWPKDRLFWLLRDSPIPVDFPACVVKLVLIIADVLVVLFIFIVLIVLAFCPLVVTLQLGGKALAAALGLHSSTQCLQMMTLLPPLFKLLMVPCPFFCHLEDISVCLVMLSCECKVLLLQALGLFRHFFHFFAEREEQFVAIVQRILHLKYYYYQHIKDPAEGGDPRVQPTCLNFST